MKLFSVKTSAKDVVLTFVTTVFFELLPCFYSTAAKFGMLVHKAFTSLITINGFSGDHKWKSLVPLIDWNFFYERLKVIVNKV